MKVLSLVLLTLFCFSNVNVEAKSVHPRMCYAAKKEYHHFMNQYQRISKSQYYAQKKVRILKHQRAKFLYMAKKLLKAGKKYKAKYYYKLAHKKLLHIRKLKNYVRHLAKKKHYLFKRIILSKKKISKYC